MQAKIKHEKEKNMKVQFKMERGQFEKLLQMVYLGEYVIRSCCGDGGEGQAYCDTAKMLYAKRYAAEYGASEQDAEENEIADMRDRLYDSTHEYLDRFQADVINEKIGLRAADK